MAVSEYVVTIYGVEHVLSLEEDDATTIGNISGYSVVPKPAGYKPPGRAGGDRYKGTGTATVWAPYRTIEDDFQSPAFQVIPADTWTDVRWKDFSNEETWATLLDDETHIKVPAGNYVCTLHGDLYPHGEATGAPQVWIQPKWVTQHHITVLPTTNPTYDAEMGPDAVTFHASATGLIMGHAAYNLLYNEVSVTMKTDRPTYGTFFLSLTRLT